MASSIGDQGLDGQAYEREENAAGGGPGASEDQGPDPVIGAGITLLGIFLMGTGGARDAHYVFDFGVLLAVLGAATFVVSVGLSVMKQRRSRLGPPPSSAPPPPATTG